MLPCQRLRDSLVRQNLRLGDHLAVGFFRLYGDLVGLGDLRQVAMLKLVRAASRCQGSQPESYLRRCISGAMLHHLVIGCRLACNPSAATPALAAPEPRWTGARGSGVAAGAGGQPCGAGGTG